MSQSLTFVELTVIAKQLGLNLPGDELQRLLPGVNRSRHQVEELRALLAQADEPAGKFCPVKNDS